MTKFVQKGAYLVKSEERRFAVRWLGEIGNDRDDRSDVITFQIALTTVLCHPGTTSFPFSGEKVEVQHGKEGSILVENLIGFYIRMIDLHILALFESDAIKPVG